MVVSFYSSYADPRELDKRQKLSTIVTVNTTPYYPLNVENPTFEIAYVSGYQNINYCYVQELNRYYFVNAPTLDSGNRIVLNCEVDPLMSFREQIVGLDCVCIRNQYDFDPYILDEDIPSSVKATTKNYIINENTPFIIPSSSFVNCYVLTLNGLVGEISNE
ncbi:MAG: hypothetical protein IJH65_13290 [Methanobrevibacter sp.]|nr:hypothetical protein [Methanobrevibacter sp.]